MASSVLNTPNAIKTLRAYWKQRTLPDPSSFLDEIEGESDRAAIILISALLDDVLTYALVDAFAIKASEKELEHYFRVEGPLGSFSAKIEIAYLFGLIELSTMDQLNSIREMRNACAHTKHNITFELMELANVAKRIFHPTGEVIIKNHSPATIRAALMHEAMIIICIVREGSRAKGREAAQKMYAASRLPSPDTQR